LTECRHPNIAKILDASFDGTLIKEQLVKVGYPGTFIGGSDAEKLDCD